MKKNLLILLAFATLGTKTTYTFEKFKAPFNLSIVPGFNGFNSSIFQKFSTLNSTNLIDFSLIAGATLSTAYTPKNIITAGSLLGLATLAASTRGFKDLTANLNPNKDNTYPSTFIAGASTALGLAGVSYGLITLKSQQIPSVIGCAAYMGGAGLLGYGLSTPLMKMSNYFKGQYSYYRHSEADKKSLLLNNLISKEELLEDAEEDAVNIESQYNKWSSLTPEEKKKMETYGVDEQWFQKKIKDNIAHYKELLSRAVDFSDIEKANKELDRYTKLINDNPHLGLSVPQWKTLSDLDRNRFSEETIARLAIEYYKSIF